jgi:hypothetical protein
MSNIFSVFVAESASGKTITGLILALFIFSILTMVRNLIIVMREARNLKMARQIYADAEADHASTDVLVDNLLEGLGKSMIRERVYLLYRIRQLHSLATDLLQRLELSEQSSNLRFIRFSMSVMLILGLLGTVLGLSMSVGGIIPTINQGEQLVQVDDLLAALQLALAGLKTAFSTTLTGLACTFFLAGAIMINQAVDNRVMRAVEHFMTTELMPRVLISSELEARSLYVEAIEKSARHIGDAADVLNRSREGIRSIVEGLVAATRETENRISDFFNFADTFRSSVSDLDTFVVKHAEKLESTYAKIDGVLREIQKNQVTEDVIRTMVDQAIQRSMEASDENARDVREQFKKDLKEISESQADYVKAVQEARDAMSGMADKTSTAFEETIKASFAEILAKFTAGLDQVDNQQEISKMVLGELLEYVRSYLDQIAKDQEERQRQLVEAVEELKNLYRASDRKAS